MQKKQIVTRNSSLDLLKILSILGVIVLHYNNPQIGGIMENPLTSSTNLFISNVFQALFIISSNVFVLISAYYLCKNNNIKVKNI